MQPVGGAMNGVGQEGSVFRKRNGELERKVDGVWVKVQREMPRFPSVAAPKAPHDPERQARVLALTEELLKLIGGDITPEAQ